MFQSLLRVCILLFVSSREIYEILFRLVSSIFLILHSQYPFSRTAAVDTIENQIEILWSLESIAPLDDLTTTPARNLSLLANNGV